MPAWLASTVQVPAAASIRVVPLTVQMLGVVETNATVRPLDAVATSAGGVCPKVWLPGDVKLMVCTMAATLKLCVTIGAAAKPELPACEAASVQLPKVTRVKALPLTVQTAGVVEAKDTGRPDVAVATKGAGAEPMVWSPGDVKLIVCAANCVATMKVCATAAAAV